MTATKKKWYRAIVYIPRENGEIKRTESAEASLSDAMHVASFYGALGYVSSIEECKAPRKKPSRQPANELDGLVPSVSTSDALGAAR